MAHEHLAYLSKAAPGLTEEDVGEILAASRRNNPKQRITGHLQCHAGYFFQVLEGPADSLDDLVARLMRDSRHSSLRVLFREKTTRRTFANWSMGFGPCEKASGSSPTPNRLHALISGAETSPQQVLSLFFALM